MDIHFKIIGVLLIVLALVHLSFPAYFNWTTELTKLSLINRQMMQVHTFFIALTVLLMGLLCLSASRELTTTSLGRKLSFGLGVFWLIRLLFQFFVYSPLLWKGKQCETVIHIFFSLTWMYFSFCFFLAALA
jgi:hypothetical protein